MKRQKINDGAENSENQIQTIGRSIENNEKKAEERKKRGGVRTV